MTKQVSKIFFLFVLLMFLFFQSSISQTQVQQLQIQQMMKASDVAKSAKISPNYGNIPLYFVPNEGQVDEKALFLAKTSRYTLWVTKEGFIFDVIGELKKKNNRNKFIDIKDRIKPKDIESDRDISKLLFLNACKNPLVVPVDTTKHKVSFFIGNNESLWNTDIPTSKAVLYKDLYKNIDLKIYGVEKQIEYDFIVRPGGDVSDIKFEYKDVNQTRIDEDDNLIIETSFGELRHMKPLSYQLIEGNKIEVETRFKKVKNDTYSFEVEKYNLEYKLTIDPLISVYSTYLGGSEVDHANGIAVDKKGAVYVTGTTYSPDFPIKKAVNGSLAGKYCIYVTKINPSGTALVYSTYLGGSKGDRAYDISVHKNGTVYVTGETSSPDFPTKNPVYESKSGQNDAFVTKINPGGTALVYSTYLGGTKKDRAYSIAIDEKGAAYVTGLTYSRNFPTVNAIFENLSDRYTSFVTKIKPSGKTLAYSTFLGGSERDQGNGIAVDKKGAVYVTGETYSSDFPTKNPIDGSLSGQNDAFVTKINQNGTALVYSTFLGGYFYDEGNDITVHKNGAVYVTGETGSHDFPTEKPIYKNNSGFGDAFVTKINPKGTALVYSTYLGGWIGDLGTGIAVHKNGAAYVTGCTFSNDFPYTSYKGENKFGSNAVHYGEAFVAKINSSGTKLIYSTHLGGSKSDRANSIAVDEKGAVYVAGTTSSNDFPTKNPIFGSLFRKSDAFITKLAIGNVIDAPTLTFPKSGAVLDNGRSDRRDDIKWRFDWSDYPGATKYQLYVMHVGSIYPLINVTVKRSTYRYVSQGYIEDRNRFNWIWKVRAGTRDSWLNWSEERRFDVERLNTDPPSNEPCDGFTSQPDYEGNCAERPPGSVCIGYEDGYTWLVYDSIMGWREYLCEDQRVRVAIGFQYEYHHIIDTLLVKKVRR